MVSTRKKTYHQVPKHLTADTHNENVDEQAEHQSEQVGREEREGGAMVVATNEPKFLTADKCEPDDVLMHCWMCPWVKPVPKLWKPYMVTGHNSKYVDYSNPENIPTALFKASNTYKRTVKHLWECGKKHNRNRGEWPSYFKRTYKGRKLKTTKIDTATMTSPMRRENCHKKETKRRYMTVEKCDAGGVVVMKCPKVTCPFVKVLPKEYVRHVTTEIEGKVLVVKTDKEAATEVRQTSQWKRMRLHAVECVGSRIPSFFKERGGM
jgi:hypothetical protein